MKSILAIAKEVVPAEVFNNFLFDYKFKEFDDTKEANGQYFDRHEHSPSFLKTWHIVDTFHRLGKHLSFRQQLNSFVSIRGNSLSQGF